MPYSTFKAAKIGLNSHCSVLHWCTNAVLTHLTKSYRRTCNLCDTTWPYLRSTHSCCQFMKSDLSAYVPSNGRPLTSCVDNVVFHNCYTGHKIVYCYSESYNAQLMYPQGPRCTVENSVTDDIFAFTEPCLHYADLVFSLPFHNSCLHRKYIFCIAQLKSCIFADLKEERKMSTYSMWVQAGYICESCIQYIPAMGTVKCCGVGNSHELLRHSLVF